MFRGKINHSEGKILVEDSESRIATSIHMLFVFFRLGIIWMDEKGVVVDTRIAYPFISFQFPKSAAKYVLEIHPKRLEEFFVGDQIEFK